MFDVIFNGSFIVDGLGSDPFRADVAVAGGRIEAIGHHLGPAKETVDLAGLHLVPGFVDIHGHSELRAMVDPGLSPKLLQGYTTELGGNCGVGLAPVRLEGRSDLAKEVSGILGLGPSDWPWSSFPELLDHLGSMDLGLDLGLLVPHGPLRRFVMGGRSSQSATTEDLRQMGLLLDQAMEAGAFGLSTGLFYDPCCYCDGRELEALFSVVAARGGLVSVHQRSEGDGILDSLDEILSPAERTGARLQISHLKIGGSRNAHKLEAVLDRIGAAIDSGVDVAFDQYPYSAGSTSLYSLLPPRWMGLDFSMLKRSLCDKVDRSIIKEEMENPDGWDGVHSLVGWGGIYLTSAQREEHQPYLGKSLEEIGGMRGEDPFDSFFYLLSEEGKALTMIDFITSDEMVEGIMAHPLQMFGTDGLYSPFPHPRTFGCSYRVLGDFVRGGKLSLSEAVNKLSSRPAARMGLIDRGTIQVGKKADLVALDMDAMANLADYGHPDRIGEGIPFVWVGGKLSVRDKVVVGEEGRLLRR
nr:D-aminoacylase [uncultured Dethiosulfovibrio sp.]